MSKININIDYKLIMIKDKHINKIIINKIFKKLTKFNKKKTHLKLKFKILKYISQKIMNFLNFKIWVLKAYN